MKLRKLKDVPYQIAQILASSEDVVRLIYSDEPSVLLTKNQITVGVNDLINDDYIGFYPATESGIKDIERNTFIIINCEDFNLQAADKNVSASGAIYITTDKAHSLLSQGKLRLLELADAIDSVLNDQKLSAAGQISLTSINYVVFSDFRSGYRINFRVHDQQTRKAEL
jgi:hypothetical protein